MLEGFIIVFLIALGVWLVFQQDKLNLIDLKINHLSADFYEMAIKPASPMSNTLKATQKKKVIKRKLIRRHNPTRTNFKMENLAFGLAIGAFAGVVIGVGLIGRKQKIDEKGQ